MIGKLLFLFVVVPLVELTLLIKFDGVLASYVGDTLSLTFMVGLVIGTGALGTYLAKREGLSILGRLQRRLAAGALPGEELVDGAVVLVSAAFLITPGMLTDALGLVGLLPATRPLLRAWVLRWAKKSIQRGTLTINVAGQAPNEPPDVPQDDPIDIDYDKK